MSSKNNAKRLLGKKIDLDTLSKTIKVVAHSNMNFSDLNQCLLIASLTCKFLHRKGFERARIVIGECAWRVDGKSAGAVVSHYKSSSTLYFERNSNPVEALAFHAWVELTPVLWLDLTTYQLPNKMKMMDDLDGSTTPVSWAPDYLVFGPSDLLSYEKVRDSFKSGVFWYREDKSLISGSKIFESIEDILEQTEEEDVTLVEEVYSAIKSGKYDAIGGPSGLSSLN